MNSGGYLPSRISTTFTDTEVNNCFSIYHTSWITSGPKSNFICENIATKAILISFGCSEANSTWLITSELANQRARKVLFTCVVYTNVNYFRTEVSAEVSRKPEVLLWWRAEMTSWKVLEYRRASVSTFRTKLAKTKRFSPLFTEKSD